MKDSFTFEIIVPVACTVAFGPNREIVISCIPNDVVRFHVRSDHDPLTVLQIYGIKPMSE